MVVTRQRGGYPQRSTLLGENGQEHHHVQVQVDSFHTEFDSEISSLRGKVSLLKQVASDITLENRNQNELLEQLESTVQKARVAVKNTMRKINRSLASSGSSHLIHVIIFAFACLLLVYYWSKHR
eukprot:TRINITY_DN892_c0_g1_i1.p1 TRINITY_DN892_c0_g1~~TRINITY_DN892_c0_g1_i1.p1  ORF type:complete len:125 (+),score=24.82 TRINITY_DN892_c0_g1_i1:149-523(+)